MTVIRFMIALVTLIAIALAIEPHGALSATPQVAESADKVLTLRNLTTRPDEVSGEIVNNSQNPVRDVNLQILYSWRWNREMRPGTDDPGRAYYQEVQGEIAPGQAMRFSFKPPSPAMMRSDGYYDVSVKVVGYSQVYRGESPSK